MKDLVLQLIRWGLGLGAFAALAFYAGMQHQKTADAKADKTALAEANSKYAEEVKKGNDAAAMYLGEHADQEDRYADLQTKFDALIKQGVPLLVPPAAGQPPAAAARPEPGVDSSGAPSPQCIQVVVRPQLSLGAVWMWNSALEGRDVPAGACGADAATPEACSAAAGLTAADAWANHTVNAQRWAEDRLRCERLIDEIERRQR